MYCIDCRVIALAAGLALSAGCASRPPLADISGGIQDSSDRAAIVTVPPPAVPIASRLGPPGPVRSWDEVRLQAAHRLVAANPQGSYTGEVPDPLLAIPVLEIELRGDGSIREIVVLRHPRQAKDTVQLAVQALHRAAPFGDVSKLPRPWRFTETFLFNDDRQFKPRTLDR